MTSPKVSMHFPGIREAKYYFPVTEKRTRVDEQAEEPQLRAWYIVGLDEVLVDLEVNGCSHEMVQSLGLIPGESIHLSAERMREILAAITDSGLSWRYEAGGTVANTLCSYTHLSGEPAILLGAIEPIIRFGSPAFAYVAQTSKAVSLEHLLPLDGDIGTALTLFTPDGERTFGVAPNVAGEYPPEAVPETVVKGAAVVLASLYSLAGDRPIAKAAIHMMELAHSADVPVAFGLGTATLVREKRERLIELMDAYVTVVAMNVREAEALTGESDALLAARKLLDWVDVGLITEGSRGLTLCGYTDDSVKRRTRLGLRSKSIANYNEWEFSRLVRKRDCQQPLQIFSHIHPYRGGPDRLANTSGAGDAALSALLHDIVANRYHRSSVPDSRKHENEIPFLTYSSLSRNAQYGNRVAYEVLNRQTPRLDNPIGSDEDDIAKELTPLLPFPE